MIIMNIHKTLLAVAVLIPVLGSCRKETAAEELSTDTSIVTAVADGGSKTIEVYASGKWTAEFIEDTDWIKIENASGDGDGELVLEFASNDGFYRFSTLKLSLSGSELFVEIDVNQESAKGSPVLNLFPPDMIYSAAEGKYEIPYSANVPSSSLSVECDSPWVKNLEVGEEVVSFTLSKNPEESRRTARIYLICTDAQQKVYKTRCTITQESKGDKKRFDGNAGNDDYTVDDDKYKW